MWYLIFTKMGANVRHENQPFLPVTAIILYILKW